MSTSTQTILRPDGRLLVRPVREWTAESAHGAVGLANRRRRSVLAHVDEEGTAELAVLVGAGFLVSRRETLAHVSVASALEALGGAHPPAGVEIRSAAEVDEDSLRLLDDDLRQDVPGTAGWRSSPEEFREHTFEDPAFDPRTYLVALDTTSGKALGLVRIWLNATGPRLGLVGVRRAHRRRGLASSLLKHALEGVRETGAADVETTFDETNEASQAFADRLGARRVATTIELQYEPSGEPHVR